MNKQKELKKMKLQHISEMIKNNLEFDKFIKENEKKLPRSQILEFLDTTISGIDTFLNIYFDFVEFMSPLQFEEFEKYRKCKTQSNRSIHR